MHTPSQLVYKFSLRTWECKPRDEARRVVKSNNNKSRFSFKMFARKKTRKGKILWPFTSMGFILFRLPMKISFRYFFHRFSWSSASNLHNSFHPSKDWFRGRFKIDWYENWKRISFRDVFSPSVSPSFKQKRFTSLLSLNWKYAFEWVSSIAKLHSSFSDFLFLRLQNIGKISRAESFTHTWKFNEFISQQIKLCPCIRNITRIESFLSCRRLDVDYGECCFYPRRKGKIRYITNTTRIFQF